ncbi:hypothetical protein [uncultured Veillonella sp.]|uniref:hypothetical protein n=1 Tax=uncultured Veillonella sp. TaxID=159268 RepID=UPI0028DB9E78|nr:hypothetical protein [uncultured Veillonella sp.]
MRVPIYEALAYYKKNKNLPYTEYFGLGFFTDKSLAKDALIKSKVLCGFSDLNDDAFIIRTHYINDCAHIADVINYDIINNTIYSVWYDYEIDEYTSGGYLGLFTSLEYAKKALEWYKTWDIFKVHSIEGLGISKIILNLRGWTEGFVTVYDE